MNKKSKIIAILLVVILLTMAIIMGASIFLKNYKNNSSVNQESISYIIYNVPYFNIYGHKDSASYIGNYKGGDYCAAFLDVFEYWNPGQNDYASFCQSLYANLSGSRVASDYLTTLSENKGVDIQEISLNLDQLKNYVNSQSRTPLITFIPLEEISSAGVNYAPASVIIGINESAKQITFHSYWLGNNYEMTFDEFEKLQAGLNSYQRNMYTIIQPKSLSEKLKEIASRKISPYPAKTSIMENAQDMFKDYSVGISAFSANKYPTALEYLNKVKDSKNFEEYFPPYFKAMLFYKLSQAYYVQNDFDNALAWAQKAVDLDHNLDKPFKDWPGYDIRSGSPNNPNPNVLGIAMEPYFAMGMTYEKRGELPQALANYKKALEIAPYSKLIESNIKRIELAILQKNK